MGSAMHTQTHTHTHTQVALSPRRQAQPLGLPGACTAAACGAAGVGAAGAGAQCGLNRQGG